MDVVDICQKKLRELKEARDNAEVEFEETDNCDTMHEIDSLACAIHHVEDLCRRLGTIEE